MTLSEVPFPHSVYSFLAQQRPFRSDKPLSNGAQGGRGTLSALCAARRVSSSGISLKIANGPNSRTMMTVVAVPGQIRLFLKTAPNEMKDSLSDGVGRGGTCRAALKPPTLTTLVSSYV